MLRTGRRRGKPPRNLSGARTARAGTLEPTSGDRWGGSPLRHAPRCRPREEPLVTPDPTTTPEPDFVSRHIGPSEDDVAAMLKVVGQPCIAALRDTPLPGVIRAERALDSEAAPSEAAVIAERRALASRNTVLTSM